MLSIGVYFEKTLDHPFLTVCKQAGMAFDPPKLATAAQTLMMTLKRSVYCLRLVSRIILFAPSSRLSAVSDDEHIYLRQNRIPSTFHDVATTS